MELEPLTEGWTAVRDYALTTTTQAGVVTVFDGTLFTVDLILKDRDGAAIDSTSKVAWLLATSGTVRVSFAAEDLKAARSPYTVHFKVTDGSGKPAFFPSRAAAILKVTPQ